MHTIIPQVDPELKFEDLAELMEGYSGDDITNLCRDASMNGMRRKILGKSPDEIRAMSKDDVADPVTRADFEEALRKISSSVSKDDITRHEGFLTEFGSA